MERPVIVSEVAVPSYRDMARDAEGEDVAQFERLVTAEGSYDGSDDGVFGWGTERAVEAWQRSLRVDDDGVVRQGDVLIVEDLPGRVLLADGIAVGRQVAPGGDAVFALSEVPTFTITLPEGQRGLVSPGVEVRVEPMGGTWPAQDATIETNAQNQPVPRLQGTDGGPVCGDECAEQVPADVEESQFRARTVVVAVDAGQAVVEGAEVGDSLRLLSGSGGPEPGADEGESGQGD